jgi:hypothetical protein
MMVSLIALGSVLGLPSTNMAMSDLNLLLSALEDGKEAFAYAHFNDGEIKALTCGSGDFTARRKQPCRPELNQAMKAALTRRAPNFYVGVVCPCAWNAEAYLTLMSILDVKDTWYSNNPSKCSPGPTKRIFEKDSLLEKRLTSGNLFVSSNFYYAKKELSRILFKAATLQNRGIHLITGSGHGMKKEVNITGLPFPITSHHTTAHFDAFRHSYTRMRSKEFFVNIGVKSGDIVMMMIGPLGRILASEWAHLYNNITILNMGSFWNAELYGKVDGAVAYIDLSLPCFWENDFNHSQIYTSLQNP